MAKTFEALKKAEKEHQISPEESKVFDLKPKPKPYIPVDFRISSQIIEEYHILNSHPEGKIKTLLFSSSTEGEGNSTVLINFGITLASGGDKVLLVDANLRNPTLHDLFTIDKKSGFTELLLEKNTLNDVIKKTQIKNLSVITSGIPHSNPFSVFESKSLDSLIEQMKAHTDWVLFDSPPINSYNDSSTLAAKMDGVVMIVHAEKTLNRRKMYIPRWIYKML